MRLALERWDRLELLDRALVIASELAANAARYARPPLHLSVRMVGRRVSIAVHDRSVELPRTGLPHSAEAESGRGMVLVDALSDETGHRITSDGKVVWASLEADGAPDDS